MKTKIANLISCFLLLSFMAACGKKDDGGSSNKNNYLNPVNLGGLSTDTATNYNSLKAWFDSTAAEQVTIGSNGSFLKESSTSGNFSFSFSLCAPMFGLNSGCKVPNGCYVNNNVTGLYVGTPTINNSQYTGCNISGVAQYRKINNLPLKDALSGKNGLSLLRATRNGSLYTLEYGTPGALTASLVYQVNTSIHSMFNPVYIKEGNSETKFLGFQIHQQ